MFSFFHNKKASIKSEIVTDLHSHLLPGIDDGVATLMQSVEIIRKFQDLGYTKLITTPHILHDFFDNTPQIIRDKLMVVKDQLKLEGCDIEIEAASEYYLDEHFSSLIDDKSEILTFGDNYVLFETGFMNEPVNLKEVIFKLKSNGLNPIMAHPERYGYLSQNFELVEDLVDRGVYMQLNITSLSGYYSKEIKKMAEKLIDNKFIHFLGSDCHHMHHMEALEKSRNKKYYRKALELNLLNNTL
ncbi:MAG: capsular biosynthesis protein [Cyclobacteriaceae bacterium]|nr:capsular biosynthesis protein [Cyclobacteriaceae bacterium]